MLGDGVLQTWHSDQPGERLLLLDQPKLDGVGTEVRWDDHANHGLIVV